MGTIVARKRKDGSTGYTAQVLRKQNGKIVHREAKTFDRKQAAAAWIKRRETELAEPGALERVKVKDVTLADAIDQYVKESEKEIGRTKAQVLKAIKEYDIANMSCSTIRSADIVSFASELADGRKPQTVANYISHLSAIFAVARAAWGYELNRDEMRSAQTVLTRMGRTSKSAKRDRRPTLDELGRIMAHYVERSKRAPQAVPMHIIVPFAIFSTRRQEEITRILWSDFEEEHSRILVRDMKHPGQKVGNDVWVELPPEAMAIIKSRPRTDERIFPYTTDAISASFTRTMQFLEINDLHFHDLRHEGVTRLFEMGRTPPQAASVSGHRSWASLQRYTHIRQSGDKYAGWKWLDIITPHPLKR